MMRRTAACAGLALALYLSSWIPFDSKPREVTQPLSFDGIDVLVLQGNPGQVTFSARASQATYNPVEIPKLLERRKGRVLVLYPEVDDRAYAYDVQLPATLRRLVVTDANVMVEEDLGMSSLEVRAAGDFAWRGDMPRLDIIDTRQRAGADCPYCGPTLTVETGRIGELRISTRFGRVLLEKPDNVRQATLFLGPDALYSLGMAKRRGQVQLLPWRAGIIEAPPQEPAPR